MRELTESKKQSYAELYFVISHLEKESKKKISKKFIRFIKENRDENFKVDYNFDIPLKDQNFHKETFSLLTIIFAKYLCKTKEEKIEFLAKAARKTKGV